MFVTVTAKTEHPRTIFVSTMSLKYLNLETNSIFIKYKLTNKNSKGDNASSINCFLSFP